MCEEERVLKRFRSEPQNGESVVRCLRTIELRTYLLWPEPGCLTAICKFVNLFQNPWVRGFLLGKRSVW
ncbi:hypothetical protein FA13DRAFT_1724796 [Coprinellus micaceus]|uniref:Uncharacterized protein n=1 Tax=Coprinellus micaceus TaxID=71717 RepID=A0A4Y7TYE9_COPMI|nr:hypothetical protein FA13DRAFT_1724796 [Coprinellus micaceus]